MWEKNEAIVCRRDKCVELGEDDDGVRNQKCVIQEFKLSVHQLLTRKTRKKTKSRSKKREQ